MATHSYTIPNQTFPSFRADLNNALEAIASNNASDTEPGTTYPFMIWVDTSGALEDPAEPVVIKMRDASNTSWLVLYELAANYFFLASNNVFENEPTVSSPELTVSDVGESRAVTAGWVHDFCAQNEPWIAPSSTNGWSFGAEGKGYRKSQYQGRKVEIHIHASKTSPVADDMLFQLPAGYRPTVPVSFYANDRHGLNADRSNWVEIDTNGVVSLGLGYTGAGEITFYGSFDY